ncbi:MAG: hypothetical protein KDC61_23390, partial [Saprospiraceae bacterium]|nr:hypothetical protein [Saprospiraceae bacterium]
MRGYSQEFVRAGIKVIGILRLPAGEILDSTEIDKTYCPAFITDTVNGAYVGRFYRKMRFHAGFIQWFCSFAAQKFTTMTVTTSRLQSPAPASMMFAFCLLVSGIVIPRNVTAQILPP